jgi:hypothetical protein
LTAHFTTYIEIHGFEGSIYQALSFFHHCEAIPRTIRFIRPMPDRARSGGLNKLISSEFHHVYSDVYECEVPSSHVAYTMVQLMVSPRAAAQRSQHAGRKAWPGRPDRPRYQSPWSVSRQRSAHSGSSGTRNQGPKGRIDAAARRSFKPSPSSAERKSTGPNQRSDWTKYVSQCSRFCGTAMQLRLLVPLNSI